jgi:protoporphyrinogen oxidase
MRIAIVGSGPAGMTAAYRLRQGGHHVEILEALPVMGGRTHAEHFGPGHHCDTGAGWLASFYTRTLALFDELGYRDVLLPRAVRGADDLCVDGKTYKLPFSSEAAAASPLLTETEKSNLAHYRGRLASEQPGGLEVDLSYDGHNAEAEFAPLGTGVVEYVMRPTFEGPFFTPLHQMSAAMMRAWLRGLLDVTFYQVAGGMDAPWLRLAQGMELRLGEPVEAVRAGMGGVEIVTPGAARRYDGAVLAVPAPAAARLLAGQQPANAPLWLRDVTYAPQVRLYVARPSVDDVDIGVHMVPAKLVASVEFASGRHGAWGACPDDWQWALVCAHGAASGPLLARPAGEVMRELWAAGRSIVPELFALEHAVVRHLIRWEWAVPIMKPGHYTRLRRFTQAPPLALAGDWMQQACVEGAVRSGEAAAAVFGTA